MNTLVFLTQEHVEAAVSNLCNGASNARLAVAFWGKGATKKLHLECAKELTVICNGRSGACNPAEIKKIMGLKSATIYTHDRLHAKVYLTINRAIVGSSNASSNGLGDEGADAEGQCEANLQTDDHAVIDLLHKWFDKRLNDSTLVDADVLKQIEEAWKRGRRARQLQKEKGALYEQFFQSLLKEVKKHKLSKTTQHPKGRNYCDIPSGTKGLSYLVRFSNAGRLTVETSGRNSVFEDFHGDRRQNRTERKASSVSRFGP